MLPRFNYALTLVDRADIFERVTGQGQAPPFDLMCAMHNISQKRISFIKGPASYTRQPPDCRLWPTGFESLAGNGGIHTQVTNLAYKRMVDKLGDSSSLGATLTAEARETYGMVVGGILRAARAAKAIRSLRFSDAARELGLPYRERTVTKRFRVRYSSRRHRTVRVKRTEFQYATSNWKTKELGSGWLMYSYGVAPLMGDIYNSMDVLQRPLPFHRIRGGGKLTSTRTITNPPGWSPGHDTRSVVLACSQSIEVRVKNPNLYLANKLGLVNPLQWVNEAIPFSFVLDWFSNLSDVISSMTDFVGLETSNPCINYFHERYWLQNNRYSPSDWIQWEKKEITRKRELTIVLPKLHFSYERFSWQRGLNAISLLLQFTGKK